jgi:hypothetical protein
MARSRPQVAYSPILGATPEQRKLLAGIVNPLMPTVNQLFDKVLAISGVAELLKPAVDALKGKLAIQAA